MKLYIVVDERCVEEEAPESALVGIFTKPALANSAIAKVQAHWKKFDGGSEADAHEVSYFEFDGEFDQVTIPVYEDEIGEEDDDDDDLEMEDDDDDDLEMEDEDEEEEEEDD